MVRVADGDPLTVDSLFLASATAPAADGLETGTVREVAEVVELVAPVVLEVELETAGLTVGFGLDEPKS